MNRFSLLFLLLFAARLAAQPVWQARGFGIAEGLPSSHISQLYEDRKGFLWVGIDRPGIWRFNGFQFHFFNLPGGFGAACEDAEGDLWITSNNGLFRLVGDSFQAVAVDSSVVGHFITGIFIDEVRGNLWLVHSTPTGETAPSTSGLSIFSNEARLAAKKTGRLAKTGLLEQKNLLLENSLPVRFAQWDDCAVWMTACQKVFRWKCNELTEMATLTDTDESGVFKPFNRGIALISADTALVNTRPGNVYKIGPGGFRELIAEGIAPNADRICRVGNRFWLGINWFSTDLQQNEDLFVSPAPDIKLLTCSLTARDGTVWIGSPQGLWRLTPHDFFPFQKEDTTRWADGIFSLLKEENGGLRLASNFGSGFYQRSKTGEFQRLPANGSRFMPGAWADFMHLDSNGDSWFGSHWNGLEKWNPAGKLIGRLEVDAVCQGSSILSFFEDANHRLWLGSQCGIWRADLNLPGKMPRFSPKNGGIGRNTFVQAIASPPGDDDGSLWLATDKGLFQQTGDSLFEKKQLLPLLPGGERLLAEPNLKTILFSADGKEVWLATDSLGVLHFERTGRRDLRFLGAFGKKQGLASDYPICLEADQRGRIWVGSQGELSVIFQENGAWQTRHFTAADGLPGNMFNHISLAAMGDSLWIGTTTGLVVMPIGQLPTRSPKAVLTHFRQKNGQFFDLRRADKAALNFEINYEQRDLVIHFSGLNLNSEKTTVFFQLENYDANWLAAGAADSAVYQNLPPGDYRFRIKTLDPSGVESPEVHFSIQILKPWWQTWWFRLLVISATGGFLWLLVSKINRRQEAVRMLAADKKRREQIRQGKIQNLLLLSKQVLMEPHFVSNVMAGLQRLMSESKFALAAESMQKFEQLNRMVLEMTKTTLLQELAEEQAFLELYVELENLQFTERPVEVSFSYETDPDLEIKTVRVPIMFLQPLVENAFKHGLEPQKTGPRLLDIHFSIENDLLLCRIRDNGDENQLSERGQTNIARQSFSLENIRNRLEIIARQSEGLADISLHDWHDHNGKRAGKEALLRLPFDLTDMKLVDESDWPLAA